MKRGWQKAVLLGIAAVGMGALAPVLGVALLQLLK